MALASDFNSLCPLFDFGNSGGVVFPFVVPTTDTGGLLVGNNGGIIFSPSGGADTSSILCRFTPIMDMRIISCQCQACEGDDGATKLTTASIEPVIGFIYGTAGLASAGAGTSIAAVTCDATGSLGKTWGPGTSTTATTISSTQEIAVYLKVEAAEGSFSSGATHGGALPIVWFAHVNAP